jgi:hypothetical protein
MKISYFAVFLVGAIAGASVMFVHLRHSHSSSPGAVVHVENAFEFTAHGPYKTVFPLFGAFGERAWAGEKWNPQFLYPQLARDVEGEVFAVAHSHLQSTWVNTAFDMETGHVQYVYVIPDAQAVRIDIHLKETDAANTGVKVAYERTALDPRFNDHVKELGNQDRESAKKWETAIDTVLRKPQGN